MTIFRGSNQQGNVVGVISVSCFEKAKRNSCPVESGPLFCVWEDVGEIVEVSGTVPAVGIVKFEIPCVVLEDCCIVACVVGEDCCHVFCIELDG